MTTTQFQRLGILALLVLTMAVTRLHHFAAIPDASWAVFFLGGFYLRGWVRWAFPLLIAVAVAVDYLVISGQGLNFWTHYCVSPAYWFLAPAYFVLWLGGTWLARAHAQLSPAAVGAAAASVLIAVSACYLISNGSFYWLSPSVAAPNLAGWIKNLGDWYLPYLGTTALYLAAAAVLHLLASLLVRALAAGNDRALPH
jgi:hypothetical protein